MTHSHTGRTGPVGSVYDSGPTSVQNPLPTASPVETAKILAEVELPTISKGPIIRRPRMVAAVENLGLEARAVTRMQTIAEKYGRGPIMLALPGRKMSMVLDPDHVHRILEESPEPFATAETLKRHALKHFEPQVALISHGPERARRREVNEQLLDHNHPIHRMAQQFMPAVREEAQALLEQVDTAGGSLDYSTYFKAWFRLVNRVVLGDSYRDDEQLIELMETQRARGNWAFFRPVDTDARDEIHARIDQAVSRAEPGSIAAFMNEMGTSANSETSREEDVQQIPQWLFAFDPAGMASYRGLALLASHQDRLDAARFQVDEEAQADTPMLPLLRATVLESLRLWATTPMILRETTREVEFEHGVMPEGTTVLIFAPFFHRDEKNLDFAHRFSPEVWDHERTRDEWPLVPFSAGPGLCPGRHLVLLLTSNFIAQIVGQRSIDLLSHDLEPGRLPALLNNFSLKFHLSQR
ncbi:cytochrome P450 [Nesterenkonia salmonea]|uniref:Cytochrome P450 n=1 Tax=Nesterenkonia salmonea TaxID=1804987 RepID=A0A5R9BCX4_9MICC|nr:cytochrome P450 [Nesterenkonia salmonea]TLP97330.1 cytochrome P450 [Nesterenkonia salmonea]